MRTSERLVMKSAVNVIQQMRRFERKKALATVTKALSLFLDEADAP